MKNAGGDEYETETRFEELVLAIRRAKQYLAGRESCVVLAQEAGEINMRLQWLLTRNFRQHNLKTRSITS